MEYKITNTVEYLFIQDGSEIIAHLPLNNSPILEGVDLLPPLEDEVDKYIQSLQQPKIPVGFKSDVEILGIQTIKYGDLTIKHIPMPGIDYTPKPKITTNSQGLTQWVGEYIY